MLGLNLRNLMESLHPVRNKWFLIGVLLNVSATVLMKIEYEHHGDRNKMLVETLVVWLEGTTDITWQSIVAVLESLDENVLAANIEQLYCYSTKHESNQGMYVIQLQFVINPVCIRRCNGSLFVCVSVCPRLCVCVCYQAIGAICTQQTLQVHLTQLLPLNS